MYAAEIYKNDLFFSARKLFPATKLNCLKYASSTAPKLGPYATLQKEKNFHKKDYDLQPKNYIQERRA